MSERYCGWCNSKIDDGRAIDLSVKASWMEEGAEWTICEFCCKAMDTFINSMSDLKDAMDEHYGVTCEKAVEFIFMGEDDDEDDWEDDE